MWSRLNPHTPPPLRSQLSLLPVQQSLLYFFPTVVDDDFVIPKIDHDDVKDDIIAAEEAFSSIVTRPDSLAIVRPPSPQ